MDKILENDKDYEYIRDKADADYDDLVAAIEIVKKFIIDNDLIIYGGTAIDYALRLKGDKIYSDEALAVPDLDFYSPNNAEHSYQLADILYNKGFKSTRVTRGVYVRTMHVDLINGHLIADLTFCPPEVFKRLPTLKYNQMKIIHPIFQRVDIHSALSFPYDNPPSEVIFLRWGKDIKRFNKMDHHYPIELAGATLPLRAFEIAVSHQVLTGFAAFAVILAHYEALIAQLSLKHMPTIDARPAEVRDGKLIFDTFDNAVEYVHFDVIKAAKELGLQTVSIYEPYMTLVPEKLVSESENLTIYSTKNRLISVNVVKVGDTKIKIVNGQAILRHFIAMANITEGKLHQTYLKFYTNLLTMIRAVESKVVEKAFGEVPADVRAILLESPLFPSTYVYGNKNHSLAYLVLLNMLETDLGTAEQYSLPWFYYPDRSIPKGQAHPKFDPESCEFFRESGRVIYKSIKVDEK